MAKLLDSNGVQRFYDGIVQKISSDITDYANSHPGVREIKENFVLAPSTYTPSGDYANYNCYYDEGLYLLNPPENTSENPGITMYAGTDWDTGNTPAVFTITSPSFLFFTYEDEKSTASPSGDYYYGSLILFNLTGKTGSGDTLYIYNTSAAKDGSSITADKQFEMDLSTTPLTEITSSMITTALGYTPYNSTNPNGYTSNTGTITGVSINSTSIATSGVADIKTNGTYNASTNKIATMSSIPTKVSDLTNDSGFINGISSSDVTTALGYTPYNSTNPSGYITSSALTPYALSSSLATVATSGSYNDLSDTPTIPSVGNSKIWYGTSATAAATQAKVVTCSGFTLETGATIIVTFTYAQTYNGTPTLNVNSTGAKSIQYKSGTAGIRYMWNAGSTLQFVYDGTYWVCEGRDLANTTYYGITKLNDTVTSTSTTLAATANSVKTAYDLANTANTGLASKQDTLVSGTSIKTINNTSLLGSGDISLPTSSDIPTKTSDLTNDSGYINGITSSMVTSALGYTPYNSTNPNGYTTNTGTITGISINGTSIATSGVANILTNTAYDSSTNKLATMSDLPDGIIQFTGSTFTITSVEPGVYYIPADTAINYGKSSSIVGYCGYMFVSPGSIYRKYFFLNSGSSQGYFYGEAWVSSTANSSLISVQNTTVKVNGTSIMNNGVADLITNTAYDSSSNKIATMSDIPSTSGLEQTANKVTSLSSSSTDDEYPSAKCVYDELANKEDAVSDTGWQTLTLASGVSQATGTVVSTPQYRKIGNHVFVRGTVTFTASSSTVTLFTCDTDYLPGAWQYKMAGTGGTRVARIGVNPNTGAFFCDWIYTLNGSGAAVTSGTIAWLDITMDWYTN